MKTWGIAHETKSISARSTKAFGFTFYPPYPLRGIFYPWKRLFGPLCGVWFVGKVYALRKDLARTAGRFSGSLGVSLSWLILFGSARSR